MLTPEDIQSREFLVSLRGYDRDEVHAFLDEVAEEFANLLARSRGAAPAVADPDQEEVVDVSDGAEPADTVEQPAAEAGDATVADADAETVVAEPEAKAEPEPAAVSFAAIGAETQRILEAAHAAGEEIRRQAEAEAAEVTKTRLSDAQGEVDSLRTQATTVSQQIQELTARREEISERLRQARETVDLALMEIDDDPGSAAGTVLPADDDEE